MASSSNLASLSEQIRAQTERDRELIEQQTQTLLDQHAQTLRQLSAAALNTTRAAIESQAGTLDSMTAEVQQQTGKTLEALAEALTQISETLNGRKTEKGKPQGGILPALKQTELATRTATRAQAGELEAAIKAQTIKLLWLMKWPLLGTVAVCLTICLLTWAYWGMASPWETMQMRNGEYQVIKGNDWTICALANGNKLPCRPIK